MAETMVRMGELAAASASGDVLAALGLGSCIGLVLLDRPAAVAGLAHVVLPALLGSDATHPGKYADTAVDALVGAMEPLGARRGRLQAVLVGGASMFGRATSSALDVGPRNDAAVRAELARAQIPVVRTETGGSHGRTVRVALDRGRVTARAAGAGDQELYVGWRSRRRDTAIDGARRMPGRRGGLDTEVVR